MPEYKHMEECFLCKRQFQFGPQLYKGTVVKEWKIIVCDICYKANWDGIVPRTYPHLLHHLRLMDIEPQPNAKGWIDWPT